MIALLRGRYRVVGAIGKGGQGELFTVDDTRIAGKTWAAKRIPGIHEPDNHPEVAALRLGLKCLPRLSEAFIEGGDLWIVRDYIAGLTLADLRSKQGRPFAAQVLGEMVSGIAEAIGALHGAGLAVLDIKPANFIQTFDGRTVLIDTGSVTPLGDAPTALSATPGMGAPELWVGGHPTVAADVYGLAATTVWLQTAADITAGDRPSHADLPSLSRRAIEAIHSALDPIPARRPSLDEFVTALASVPTVTCASCGRAAGNGKYCGSCGSPLTGDSIAVPVKPRTDGPRLLPPTVIQRRPERAAAIARKATSGRTSSKGLAELWKVAEQLAVIDGFDSLIALDRANIDAYKHQEVAALRILREFRGSGVLADEVGLGKTIEAGIILNELLARQLASRVLVLAPPHLTNKWAAELATKFLDSSFVVCSGPGNWGSPRLIASHRQAVLKWFTRGHASYPTDWRRFTAPEDDPHRCVCSCGCTNRTTEQLTKCDRCEGDERTLKSDLPEYDVVIVDEAHHLYRTNGSLTSAGVLVSRLRRRFLLLLTATPVRRDSRELYQLISLVRPGEFKDVVDFDAKVARPLAEASTRQGAIGELQAVLDRVMVRQRRRDLQIQWPAKEVFRHVVPPSAGERAIQEDARQRAGAGPRAQGMRLLRAAHSSPMAVAQLLGVADSSGGTSAKQARLLEVLAQMPNERVVVFSEFRQTLSGIAGALEGAGRKSVMYEGARAKKLEAVRTFRRTEGSVLLADLSLSEGADLQFAHHLVIHDIPWNPFALEQMVGRLYRIGQEHAVDIHALVYMGALDQELFDLYSNSLRMFDRQVGELDAILGQLDDDFDFAKEVWEAVSRSRTPDELRDAFDALRRAIDEALRELRDEDEFLRKMGLA